MTGAGLPADAGIGRVALRVGDLDSTVRFYEELVGLERVADTEPADGTRDVAVLGAGDEPLLRLVADPDAPRRDDRAAGLYHVAVRVPDRAALGAAIERLRDAGRLDGAADHLVSEAVYCSDPEGNGVEVYADRPRSEWDDEPAGEASSRDPDEPPRVAIDTMPLAVEELLARSDGAATVPPGTDVGHVHLEVTSLADARAFYVDALGANVRSAFGDAALFVAAGDYHHHVGLNTWNGRSRPTGDALGLDWFEVTVPDRAALDAAAERLASGRFEPARTEECVAVRDPDGIEVRLRVADR